MKLKIKLSVTPGDDYRLQILKQTEVNKLNYPKTIQNTTRIWISKIKVFKLSPDGKVINILWNKMNDMLSYLKAKHYS